LRRLQHTQALRLLIENAKLRKCINECSSEFLNKTVVKSRPTLPRSTRPHPPGQFPHILDPQIRSTVCLRERERASERASEREK
jgi:hypothetical protein